MYKDYKYFGVTLAEWQKEISYTLTLGEMYEMAQTGELKEYLQSMGKFNICRKKRSLIEV